MLFGKYDFMKKSMDQKMDKLILYYFYLSQTNYNLMIMKSIKMDLKKMDKLKTEK